MRVMVMALGVAATVWLLAALRGVLLLVVLAIFFAYVLAPLVDRACRPVTLRGREHAMPRTLAIGVVYLLTFAVLALGAAFLLPHVGAQITQLTQQAPSYLEAARSRALGWTTFYETYRLPAAVRDAINTSVMHTTELAGTYVTEGLGSVIIQGLGYLPRLVLIPILAFSLLKDSTAFRAIALRTLPRGRWRARGHEVLQDISATLAVYTRAQLIQAGEGLQPSLA